MALVLELQSNRSILSGSDDGEARARDHGERGGRGPAPGPSPTPPPKLGPRPAHPQPTANALDAIDPPRFPMIVSRYDRTLCSEVVSAFVGELARSLRRRAKRVLGLGSVADAHTGAVAAIQGTDSAIRLNVHAHVVALDGVYVREDGSLIFHALPTPTRADVADVARRTAERIERILRAHGRSIDPEMQDDQPPSLVLDEPGLAACHAAAAQGICVTGDRAGQPALRLVVSQGAPFANPALDDADADEPVAPQAPGASPRAVLPRKGDGKVRTAAVVALSRWKGRE